MPTIPEQISAAAQTQLATQLTVINALSHTAFGGIQKLIALNFSMVKQSLESSTAATRELFAAKGPQELLALSSAQSQPQIEKIMSYGREIANITGHARIEFLHAVEASGYARPHADAVAPAVLVAIEATTAKPKAKPLEKTATPLTSAAVQAVTVKKIKQKTTASAQPSLAGNTQLPLLAESATKASKPAPAAKPVAKTAAKPVLATPAAPAAQAKPVVKTIKAASATVPAATPAPVKPATVVPAIASVVTAPVAKPVVTKAAAKPAVAKQLAAPALAAAEVKPVAPVIATPVVEVQPVVAQIVTTEAVAEKPAVAATETSESKPAVTGLPSKAAAKPAFPATGGRPAYKGKASAATGAKMRVRQ